MDNNDDEGTANSWSALDESVTGDGWGVSGVFLRRTGHNLSFWPFGAEEGSDGEDPRPLFCACPIL